MFPSTCSIRTPFEEREGGDARSTEEEEAAVADDGGEEEEAFDLLEPCRELGVTMTCCLLVPTAGCAVPAGREEDSEVDEVADRCFLAVLLFCCCCCCCLAVLFFAAWMSWLAAERSTTIPSRSAPAWFSGCTPKLLLLLMMLGSAASSDVVGSIDGGSATSPPPPTAKLTEGTASVVVIAMPPLLTSSPLVTLVVVLPLTTTKLLLLSEAQPISCHIGPPPARARVAVPLVPSSTQPAGRVALAVVRAGTAAVATVAA